MQNSTLATLRDMVLDKNTEDRGDAALIDAVNRLIEDKKYSLPPLYVYDAIDEVWRERLPYTGTSIKYRYKVTVGMAGHGGARRGTAR